MGYRAPVPNVLPVDWLPGRIFTTEDDPDRVQVPHEAPEDVLRADNGWCSTHLMVEDVDLSRVSTSWRYKTGFAKMVHGVLLPQECQALIECSNKKGFTPALLNIGLRKQQYRPEIRLNHRCIVDEGVVAEVLWQRLRDIVPSEWHGRNAQSINERMRFLCYHEPEQRFDAHFDGDFTRAGDHPRAGETSCITLQVYLNDGFSGGHTSFICKNDEAPVKVIPRQGSVLAFSQNLLHEGSAVEAGIKYTMRTEVMYAPKDQPLRSGTGQLQLDAASDSSKVPD